MEALLPPPEASAGALAASTAADAEMFTPFPDDFDLYDEFYEGIATELGVKP